MEDTRKGFLTPEGEKVIERVVKLGKWGEKFDGIVIALVDNQVLERAKAKIVEKHPESLPVIYEIVDELVKVLDEAFPEETEN
jgi:hypothetical protein